MIEDKDLANVRFGEHSKNTIPVLENVIPEIEITTEVVRILVIFQYRPMFSHINEKLSPKKFE